MTERTKSMFLDSLNELEAHLKAEENKWKSEGRGPTLDELVKETETFLGTLRLARSNSVSLNDPEILEEIISIADFFSNYGEFRFVL